MLARVSSTSGAEDAAGLRDPRPRRAERGAHLATLGARSFEPRQGKTLIVVEIIDQAHLHGILESLRDQAIDIERVNPV